MNPQTNRRPLLRRSLVGLAALITLIALFYTVENWRGKRAWDNCKRALEAQGVDFDWNHYIPAPVPDDQNVFGVPEMQKWFTGRGATEWSKKLSFPTNNAADLVVAELRIELPGASAPNDSGAAVLHWGDPQARAEAVRLIMDAVSPMATHPVGFIFTLHPREQIRPAQILLQCQTAPEQTELLQFLTGSSNSYMNFAKIQVEPAGGGSYKVTMIAPGTVADFLKWSDQLEPEFTLIRHALQRPCSRMGGDYSAPVTIPIPNFVTVRSTEQTLAAMTQCHLVQGKPEEALRDLTLMHDLCRIMEGSHPMTLVSAMINVAVEGLYVNTMADDLRWHAWREPQLAALEQQLQQFNLLPPVRQSLEMEREFECRTLENAPRTGLREVFGITGKANSWKDRKQLFRTWLYPRGWVYQNIVTIAKLFPGFIASVDPASQIVFPDKLRDAGRELEAVFSHRSPYVFMAMQMTPNFNKALQRTAQNQTMVNQAIIACALERYHLAHGEYPEKLDALLPQFLAAIPHDVIGGKPPHYHRSANGSFTLYSIGWTGIDHGGVPGKTISDGDWVWLAFL